MCWRACTVTQLTLVRVFVCSSSFSSSSQVYHTPLLRIRDAYPGSEFFPFRIHGQKDSGSAYINSSSFKPKICSWKYDPGCSSRIRILVFYPSRIRGSNRHRCPDPESGSAVLAHPRVCFFLSIEKLKQSVTKGSNGSVFGRKLLRGRFVWTLFHFFYTFVSGAERRPTKYLSDWKLEQKSSI